MQYNEIYNFVNQEIKRVEIQNEETTKQRIVIPVLNLLGYKNDCFTFEYRKEHKCKVVDIFWKNNNNDMLYIEVKNADNDITESDVHQLTVYILANNINWGILTNGKRYILINKDIGCDGHGESICMNRVVLDENVCANNKKMHMKYFSKEYIFDNKCTNYFRDIAQFKSFYLEKKKTGSWIQYQCTLYNFAEYLVRKHHKYISLNYINFEDFKDYWEDKAIMGNEIKSLKTYKAQYAHISSMFYTLHENEKITGNNNFAYITTKDVEDLYRSLCRNKDINKDELILNEKHVKEAIRVLSNKREGNRNIIIILLAVYCGITLSEIMNLKWKDIDLKNYKIALKCRTIPISKSIKERLAVLQEDYKKKKVKTPNVFYRYYNKKYTAITVCAINYIFDTLKESFWAKCSLERICSALIPLLYKNGYSIEEISYLTGKSLNLLEKSIPYDEMIKGIRLDKNHKERKHPFANILGL